MALITSHKRPTALRGAAIPVACRRRCFKSSPSPTCHPLPVHLRGPLVASVASILKTLRPNTPSLPSVTRYPLPHQCSLTKLPYCPPPLGYFHPRSLPSLTYFPATSVILSLTTATPSLSIAPSLPARASALLGRVCQPFASASTLLRATSLSD
jgi:hypothetical protein